MVTFSWTKRDICHQREAICSSATGPAKPNKRNLALRSIGLGTPAPTPGVTSVECLAPPRSAHLHRTLPNPNRWVDGGVKIENGIVKARGAAGGPPCGRLPGRA